MKLGGTVAGEWRTPMEWEACLVASHFKAVTAPFTALTPKTDTDAFCEIAARHHVVIAEVGVWKNLMDPDAGKARENRAFAKAQLTLADERNIPCCVNIAGTRSAEGWDAADPSNFTQETYDEIIAIVREILDEVKPRHAFYCMEPMPWMVPDSPESYLQLIRDVDRKQFAAHMDFVNMINCPRRYLAPEAFIETCFRTLGPYIKSTHLKDTRMHPTHLTTVLEECSPGEGTLDFGRVLSIMARYLPSDAPVLLEHMQTFEAYAKAYDVVACAAEGAGVSV